MLHVESTFEQYAERPAADPAAARQVLVGVSAESRADVDDVIATVVAAAERPVSWSTKVRCKCRLSRTSMATVGP